MDPASSRATAVTKNTAAIDRHRPPYAAPPMLTAPVSARPHHDTPVRPATARRSFVDTEMGGVAHPAWVAWAHAASHTTRGSGHAGSARAHAVHLVAGPV